MKDTTRNIILNMAFKNGFTFYAPVSIALGVKGLTAEKYLKQLEKEGLMVSKDDGIHAVTFELVKSSHDKLQGDVQFARAIATSQVVNNG